MPYYRIFNAMGKTYKHYNETLHIVEEGCVDAQVCTAASVA